MAGSTTARWFDPSNGDDTPVSGSPFTNTGHSTFNPSTSDASTDFILLRQAP
jgi:Putative collagen-binding domain of a collagenase